MPVKETDSRLKRYSTFANMRYCFRCTREYLPALLRWCAASVLLAVLSPLVGILLPRAALAALEGGGTVWTPVGATLVFSVLLALCMGGAKLCEKYLYQYKLLMGSYYMGRISEKGLCTDYQNQEDELFCTLQQESFRACNQNESELRNVYYMWTGFLSGLLGLFVYAVILGRLGIWLLPLLAGSGALGYWIAGRESAFVARNAGERAKYNRELGYVDAAAEEPVLAKEIRLYRMERWLQRVYARAMEKLAGWYRRYLRAAFGSALGSAALTLLREGVVYGYLLYLAWRGELGAAEFVFYFGAVAGFSAFLRNLLEALAGMRRISVSVNRLRSYLEFPERFRREGGLSTAALRDAPRTIELQGVSYRYPGAAYDTLSGFNLRLEPGAHVGVVGLNGAGKTTLVKLICGLCDPTEGEILYDGVPLREYNREEYYALFSAVFQQFSVLPLTVAQVVAETADEPDRVRVQSCLALAGLWERVRALPEGMDTPLDPSIREGGVRLSGGETQKLMLARAIYKDAPVLVLDEPTAALDPISESELYRVYHEIARDKTSLFISHRLASTRFCNRILLVENGAVLEEGTHEQLLARGGRYSELYRTQAEYYREHPGEEEKR